MPSKDTSHPEEQAQLLAQDPESGPGADRSSLDSVSSVSTTSLVLERLNESSASGNGSYRLGQANGRTSQYRDKDGEEEFDLEDASYIPSAGKPVSKKALRIVWIVGALLAAAWLLALFVFLAGRAYRHASTYPHDPAATATGGSRKQVTLDQVLTGFWRASTQDISWINGAQDEDGLLLEKGGASTEGYLFVEDVRSRSKNDSVDTHDSLTLMKDMTFKVDNNFVSPADVWPSRDLKSVLVVSEKQSNWRHSFTGYYWIFDVATQSAKPLDWTNPKKRVQLASWSPMSDAVVFTRDNNLYLRRLDSKLVMQITRDGGDELFYGVPDWVYEEEVFGGNSATWWANDGKHIAFLKTNESLVPEYPIQYFVSRPSGEKPPPGEESYPEVREIKYPKAGAPNPIVELQFYDIEKKEVFSVDVEGDFADDDRLITEVVWAGSSGEVLVRETNRESDILQVVLINVKSRTGKVVRTVDVNAIDYGWFEVSQETRYIPADAARGRLHDGYIDTIIHDGYDHLAYFTPLDNPEPVLLTSGSWEVVKAPSAVDLDNNLVYFIGTKEAPIQRHVYSVKLDGSDFKAMTDVTKEGHYEVSFSKGASFALLSYKGPNIPWQKVISTPSNGNEYEHVVEENEHLAEVASQHELPMQIFQNVTIDGFTLQVVEKRPPHFDPKKKYPVIFHLYGGPGSQTVSKTWGVDFQAYMAANLGYIVVTVDGRGTGFIGREARCIVRGNIGYYEARDQIETAKIWAAKSYVDESRLAIWGWSYGGFLTLKTLEQDGGKTFQYGMAVAPVTDWRFYGMLSIPWLSAKIDLSL